MKANLTALAALLCLGISVGVDAVAPSDAWDEARRILDDGVESRVFPGASALVGGRDGVLFQHSTGRLTYGEQPPHGSNEVVSQDTVFDLASLSKVVGTTSVVAWLYEKGYLDLGDLVSSETLLGPAFAQNGKGAITLEDCMLHQAGFPPDPSPNYWDPKFGCPGAPLPADQTFACSQKSYDSLMSQSLDSSPGERYVYSDLSMITMMFVAGQIIRRNALVSQVFLLPECADYPNSTAVQLQCHFEAFLRARIVPEIAWSSQQGMSVLGYRLHSFVWSRTAPTETVAASGLNVTLQGRVEDGNCEMLGGVSGHAGIFSTTRDLSALMHTLVFPGVAMDGTPAPHVFLNATTLSLFTTERNHAISSRALGWNTNDPSVTDEGWNLSCGNLSPKTFMHLGYTGTQVCCDPVNQVYTVLLTNRVYPTDQGKGIHTVRQDFHNAVAKAIGAQVA